MEFLQIFECHPRVANLLALLNVFKGCLGCLGQKDVDIRVPHVSVVGILVDTILFGRDELFCP
jgi:hypothetical protein